MMVIPCLGSQSLLKSSSMPGADFSNSQEFPEADGMAFVQNLGVCVAVLLSGLAEILPSIIFHHGYLSAMESIQLQFQDPL